MYNQGTVIEDFKEKILTYHSNFICQVCHHENQDHIKLKDEKI